MPSAFEVLSRDHEEVRQMLAELESGPTAATGAGPDQLAARKKMAETLIIEESRHEAAEEMYFWPAVRERLPDGDQLADEAISQEREGREILARLDQTDADDLYFEGLLSEFIGAGRDHIAFEEHRVWPGLRARLTEAEASELGAQVERAKKTGPAFPHPHCQFSLNPSAGGAADLRSDTWLA